MGGIVKAVTKPIASIVSAPFKMLAPEPKEPPKVNTPAPAAPPPEKVAENTVRPENIGSSRKRRGRSGLRIDLNTGGSGNSGVNVPLA